MKHYVVHLKLISDSSTPWIAARQASLSLTPSLGVCPRNTVLYLNLKKKKSDLMKGGGAGRIAGRVGKTFCNSGRSTRLFTWEVWASGLCLHLGLGLQQPQAKGRSVGPLKTAFLCALC